MWIVEELKMKNIKKIQFAEKSNNKYSMKNGRTAGRKKEEKKEGTQDLKGEMTKGKDDKDTLRCNSLIKVKCSRGVME